MALEKQYKVDEVTEDEAERIVSPRPSSKRFSSLAERSLEHDRLYKEGLRANSEGRVDVAKERFITAYALLFRRSTLFSLVNMILKQGDAELAVACYRKMVSTQSIGASERVRMMAKLHEAGVQWNALRDIVQASQVGRLNSAEDREKRAYKLLEKAKAANEAGESAAVEGFCSEPLLQVLCEPVERTTADACSARVLADLTPPTAGEHATAESLFLDVWRLTFRNSALISAANMMARQESRERLAAAIYFWARRRDLTADERATVDRKLNEVRLRAALTEHGGTVQHACVPWPQVQQSLLEAWRMESAARLVQKLMRGHKVLMMIVVMMIVVMMIVVMIFP